MPEPATDLAWTVVLPFKGGAGAKSRLGPGTEHGFAPAFRHELALAFLQDTVAAVTVLSQVVSVVVVSSDQTLTSALPGIARIPDPGQGLNAAAAAGIAWARKRDPGGAVAVLAADLPALTPPDLSTALDLAGEHGLGVVPDRQGSGSTMITAHPGMWLTPRFGPNSSSAHVRADHVLLPVPESSSLRLDVDTPEDIREALRRGAGERTRAAIARFRSGQMVAASQARINTM